jgi:type VI protein secretion system component VasK
MEADAATKWMELLQKFGYGAILLTCLLFLLWGLLKLLRKEWESKDAKAERMASALDASTAAMKADAAALGELQKAVEERNRTLIRLLTWLEATAKIPPGSGGAGA